MRAMDRAGKSRRESREDSGPPSDTSASSDLGPPPNTADPYLSAACSVTPGLHQVTPGQATESLNNPSDLITTTTGTSLNQSESLNQQCATSTGGDSLLYSSLNGSYMMPANYSTYSAPLPPTPGMYSGYSSAAPPNYYGTPQYNMNTNPSSAGPSSPTIFSTLSAFGSQETSEVNYHSL